MAPPSPLAIATGSVQRLVKEEASYHKELMAQEAHLEKLLASTEEDENKEYTLKQEVGCSLKTTVEPCILANLSSIASRQSRSASSWMLLVHIELPRHAHSGLTGRSG